MSSGNYDDLSGFLGMSSGYYDNLSGCLEMCSGVFDDLSGCLEMCSGVYVNCPGFYDWEFEKKRRCWRTLITGRQGLGRWLSEL